MITASERKLLSGNEALALAALHAGFKLGTGYPGTPSTEILEAYSDLGGNAQWSPNEKVALEVGLGAAYAGARALVTMKHVGLNVAADPLFTAAYTGVHGALIIVTADDPGMASSQNEQDNRRYAVAAGLPLFEPSDSQEVYDFLFQAVFVSEKWNIPALYRMTTRVCHSKTVVQSQPNQSPAPQVQFTRDIRGRVMIPANARPAHRRLRQKLEEIAEWNESTLLNRIIEGHSKMGVISSGVAFMHSIEAAPKASHLKLGVTHPLPYRLIRQFVKNMEHTVVIEEGDPYLSDSIRARAIPVVGKPEEFRFGELSVHRVRKILYHDSSADPVPPPGKPPELCVGCPHRSVFTILRDLECIVSGDIGCYSLGALPPFLGMDTCVCMGASVGVGLGLRHVLPEDQARRVVSVIGDSTFVHSGITGLVEMIYNPPATGHLVMILDNGTTAMTGLQEHPGTGRTLDHKSTGQVDYEALARSIGLKRVFVVEDPAANMDLLENLIRESLNTNELSLIITRCPCILAFKRIKQYEKANVELAGQQV